MDEILRLQNEGKDLILKGQEILIEGNSQIREGQEKIIIGQEIIDEGHNLMNEGQEKIIKGHELLNKGQDALEEVKELLEKLMNSGVITTIGISSKESSQMAKKSSQQELKENFERGDPSVGLLGESSRKIDYYVKYSPPEISASQVEKSTIQNAENHNFQPNYLGKKEKKVTIIDTLSKMTMSEEYLQDYHRICRMAYSMRPIENCHPIHEGIYPKINFMQGANPKAIKELFNYGFVNCIYLSKNNEEVSELPKIIRQGVKDFKTDTKAQGVVFVKIYFVALEWEKSQYFPNHHIVQIGIQSKKVKVEANEDQIFQDFEESLCGIEFIQERRALGFKVLLQTFDRMIKMRKTWTYGFSKEILVVSTCARLMTSISLFKIRQKR
ncbi:hypothetical protein SLA2020_136180 [Shorea laevis]